jgi:hypothetical protein
MNATEFIDLLQKYDFVRNSVNSFCKIYKVTPKTVRKYLKEYDIKYNNRTIIHVINRDENGRFCINNEVISEGANSHSGKLDKKSGGDINPHQINEAIYKFTPPKTLDNREATSSGGNKQSLAQSVKIKNPIKSFKEMDEYFSKYLS